MGLGRSGSQAELTRAELTLAESACAEWAQFESSLAGMLWLIWPGLSGS